MAKPHSQGCIQCLCSRPHKPLLLFSSHQTTASGPHVTGDGTGAQTGELPAWGHSQLRRKASQLHTSANCPEKVLNGNGGLQSRDGLGRDWRQIGTFCREVMGSVLGSGGVCPAYLLVLLPDSPSPSSPPRQGLWFSMQLSKNKQPAADSGNKYRSDVG